jgi:hypothetical protein
MASRARAGCPRDPIAASEVKETEGDVPQLLVALFRRTWMTVSRHGPMHLVRVCFRAGAEKVRGLVPRPKGNSPAARRDPDPGEPAGADLQGDWQSWVYLGGIDSPNWKHGIAYKNSDGSVLRQMVESLPIRHEDFLFLDLGAGKGMALLMAAEYPFREIIGVEYSRPLQEIAAANLAACVGPAAKCRQVSCVCLDAVMFKFPPQPTVLFLGNPFDEVIMEQVLGNLVGSLRRDPRPIYVLYYNGVCAEVLRRHGFHERLSLRTGPTTHYVFDFAPRSDGPQGPLQPESAGGARP